MSGGLRPGCRVVSSMLPWLEDTDAVERLLGGHVRTCLRCQAEQARYRALRRRMAGLDLPVPAATLRPTPRRRVFRGLAGAAVVAAAFGTAAVVGYRRARVA